MRVYFFFELWERMVLYAGTSSIIQKISLTAGIENVWNVQSEPFSLIA